MFIHIGESASEVKDKKKRQEKEVFMGLPWVEDLFTIYIC